MSTESLEDLEREARHAHYEREHKRGILREQAGQESRQLTAQFASGGRVVVGVGGRHGPYRLSVRYLTRDQLDRVTAVVLRELGLEPAGRSI